MPKLILNPNPRLGLIYTCNLRDYGSLVFSNGINTMHFFFFQKVMKLLNYSKEGSHKISTVTNNNNKKQKENIITNTKTTNKQEPQPPLNT